MSVMTGVSRNTRRAASLCRNAVTGWAGDKNHTL